MSGTSLDGLDIAYCEFTKKSSQWNFRITEALTYTYTENWQQRLKRAPQFSALELIQLNKDFGILIGRLTDLFIKKFRLRPDFIASHGHTIFHNPKQLFTYQIGNGSHIAAITGIPVITNFRDADVAKGGQGAPLVPIGDKLLFNEYDACLNLGGIANISFDNSHKKRVAYDIAPMNMALNYVAEQAGQKYDNKGKLAKTGKLNKQLYKNLNNLPYYYQSYPKSLGREWFESEMQPVLAQTTSSIPHILATLTEHIACQISKNLGQAPSGKILVTGGGTYNDYFMERLRDMAPTRVVVPSSELVDFKEALIFAFLGTLYYENQTNILASVTGARADSIGGTLHHP